MRLDFKRRLLLTVTATTTEAKKITTEIIKQIIQFIEHPINFATAITIFNHMINIISLDDNHFLHFSRRKSYTFFVPQTNEDGLS